MNKQQLLAAAEVMRRAAEGEVVEMKAKPDKSWNVAKYVSIWNWNAGDYRILDFTVPPCGQSWHNPAGLTATQVGVHEGWRLLITGWGLPDDAEKWNGRVWWKREELGLAAGCYGYQGDGSTWRTKSPLPVATNSCEVACKKAFPQSWNVAIQEIWNEAWKAAKEHENNQKDNK